MKIFIDVDGTILDIWQRYFRVFCDSLIKGHISFEEYKRYKMFYGRDDDVAHRVNVELSPDYYQNKKEMLEAEEYLILDTPLIDVETLEDIISKYKIGVLSKRKYADRLYSQLRHLGLESLLDDITVLGWGKDVKKEWIKRHYFSEQIILIGDGEEEIAAAMLENVQLILVTTGLYQLHPDKPNIKIIKDINQVEHILIKYNGLIN